MKIYHDSNLLQQLSNYIFIDTNVLIGAIKYHDLFGPFLKAIKENGGTFLTIPSVTFEFLRGTDDVEDYKKREEFIKQLCVIYPIQNHDDDIKDLQQILGKDGKNMSYTDFLLCVCAKKFHQGSHLITADLKDIPLKFFKRINVFTVDTDSDVRVYAVYSLR